MALSWGVSFIWFLGSFPFTAWGFLKSGFRSIPFHIFSFIWFQFDSFTSWGFLSSGFRSIPFTAGVFLSSFPFIDSFSHIFFHLVSVRFLYQLGVFLILVSVRFLFTSFLSFGFRLIPLPAGLFHSWGFSFIWFQFKTFTAGVFLSSGFNLKLSQLGFFFHLLSVLFLSQLGVFFHLVSARFHLNRRFSFVWFPLDSLHSWGFFSSSFRSISFTDLSVLHSESRL